MDTKVDSGSFAHFHNLVFHLFGHFRYHLFDTRRVNSSVLNELVKRKARYLTAHRVEGGKGDCFRSVIHHNLHTRSRFQRTDITSFTTDDTTFDFVILDMEDRNGALCGGL